MDRDIRDKLSKLSQDELLKINDLINQHFESSIFTKEQRELLLKQSRYEGNGGFLNLVIKSWN